MGLIRSFATEICKTYFIFWGGTASNIVLKEPHPLVSMSLYNFLEYRLD